MGEELTWPREAHTIPGLIPGEGDIDILERSWSEVEPFATAFRPAIMRGGNAREDGAVDGDTWELMIDLGYDVSGFTAEIRLIGWHCGIVDHRLGVNAWETAKRGWTTDEMKQLGLKAKTRVNELLPVGSTCLTRSRIGGRRGSIGRWLGLVLVPISRDVPPQEARWVSIGDLLMAEGLATVWWKGWNHGRARPDQR